MAEVMLPARVGDFLGYLNDDQFELAVERINDYALDGRLATTSDAIIKQLCATRYSFYWGGWRYYTLEYTVRPARHAREHLQKRAERVLVQGDPYPDAVCSLCGGESPEPVWFTPFYQMEVTPVPHRALP